MTRGRWITLLLIISVTLNLTSVGAVIGISFMRPDARPINPDVSIRWLYRALGEENRESLRPIFEQHREELGSLRGDIRDAQRAFEAGLNTDAFETDRVSETLAESTFSSLLSSSEIYSLNTSLNIKGMPIVNTHNDGIGFEKRYGIQVY